MKKTFGILSMAALLFLPAAALPAEVQIEDLQSTGLGLEGRKGYLGGADTQDRLVVHADESPIFLLFFWDGKDLEPWVKVERKGVVVAELDLTKGNKLTLIGGGDFVCTISSRKGSGHWLCVTLSGREWDP